MDNQKVEFGFDTIAMEDDTGASLSELQSHYKVDGVEVWKNYVELYKFNEGESFGNYSVSMLEIPIDTAGKPLPTDIYMQSHGLNERTLLSATICVHGECVGFQNIVGGSVRQRDGVWGPTVQANYTRLITPV
ncbi:hypothetical protein [Serratia liquefaciens]|uniref:hypothetical protein n=1 Tax=Serratia liquefaciens TaxID=614 RepID=UPI00061B82E1|nr:hypothetical protein [Serratia liquefaciens]AKE10851.1 hypothetical protein XJ20_13520 [Serratia liquefaciens]